MAGSAVEGARDPPRLVVAAVAVATAAADAIIRSCSATVGLVGLCGVLTSIWRFYPSPLV